MHSILLLILFCFTPREERERRGEEKTTLREATKLKKKLIKKYDDDVLKIILF